MAEIGRRIKAAREAAGLTQAELAAKLGYKSKSTINKIEMGINDISQSKVEAFAAALGTTPAYLMGWDASADDDTSDAPAYYLNPETAKAAQEMLDNKELRVLFDAARDNKKPRKALILKASRLFHAPQIGHHKILKRYK